MDLPPARASSIAPDAFGNWAGFQPGAAADWLLQLAADDPRRRDFLERYATTAAYLSRAAAVEQLRRLGSTDREVAREAIRRAGIDEARRADLLEALAE